MGDDAWDLRNCYEAQGFINSGAFGDVCWASVDSSQAPPHNAYFQRLFTEDIVEGETPIVAIKKLHKEKVFQSSQAAKQVYREILLLKELIHFNVVKLVDVFFSAKDDLYIVMEKMPADLAQLIASDYLQDNHIDYIVYGLIRGLLFIHSAGIIHRDLKPSNILISDAMDVKICDFGWARPAEADQTVTGYVTTRWYRAPEVMMTWRHYTAALDMWGVGCIFAELLNKVRGHVTATSVDKQSGEVINFYALFPAEDHVSHLEMIVNILGAPSEDVMATCTDQNIRNYLQGTIDKAQFEGPGDLGVYFEGIDDASLALLRGLLDINPRMRLDAASALNERYLSKYHDETDEYTRPPIDQRFEQMDIPAQHWKTMLKRLVEDVASLPEFVQQLQQQQFQQQQQHQHQLQLQQKMHEQQQQDPNDLCFSLPNNAGDEVDEDFFMSFVAPDDNNDMLTLDVGNFSEDPSMPGFQQPFSWDENNHQRSASLQVTLEGLQQDRQNLFEQTRDANMDDLELMLSSLSDLDARISLLQQAEGGGDHDFYSFELNHM
eukprot:m.11529 g.11529  ORF g.11529 m.11529 type:complete len:548 (+) comp3854_c0_seq1:141-1784(+)